MRYCKLIILVLTILVISSAMNAWAAASIPLMIPYSGTIAVDGAPFNGDGQFKFAVVNGHTDCQLIPLGPGCIIYWSNDDELINGTSGKEPKDYIILPSSVQDVISNGIPVSNGIFSVKLGDTSLTNMQALPEGLFNSSATYLRIWFSDGTDKGFQLLSPDRQLVSVPYAFRSHTSDELSGTINPSQIIGTIGSTQITDNSVATTDLAFDPATQAELDVHKGGGDHDSRYPAKTDLSTAGTINTATNPVDWTKLKSVPPGFADGIDDTGASYTPGTGINITSTTIGIADGGVGSTQISDESISSIDILNGSIQAIDIGDLPPNDSDYLQNQSSASQTASFWISGNMRAGGAMRLGSETGTTEGPNYPASSSGILVRRVNTNTTTAGTIVATTGFVQLERDGTDGGFQAKGNIGESCSGSCYRVQCMGINDLGTFIGKNVTVNTSGTVAPIYTDLDNMVYIRCALGNPWGAVLGGATHQTVVELQRWDTGSTLGIHWLGFVTSTFNQ